MTADTLDRLCWAVGVDYGAGSGWYLRCTWYFSVTRGGALWWVVQRERGMSCARGRDRPGLGVPGVRGQRPSFTRREQRGRRGSRPA